MPSPTVLVTGGTGFVGSHTARVLVNEGYDVVVTDVSTDLRRLEKLGVADSVTVQQLDLTDSTAVFRTIRRHGATHIVHLGAVTSLIARNAPRTAIDVNVTGTNNVFEAARTLDDQIDRVAWASTMAVYAPASKYPDGPVDEDDLVYPDSIYGATKEFCEHQARLYREQYDLSLVGLRPTGVYGPFNTPDLLEPSTEIESYRSPSGRLAGLFTRAALERPVSMTVSTGAMDWIYVEDVARLFEAALFAPEDDVTRPVYNASSGETASIETIADIIRDYVPNAEIELEIEDESPYVSQINGTAARNDFGVDPKYDLRDGIQTYLNTIRADQGLKPIGDDD